jgi:hypothetical protein
MKIEIRAMLQSGAQIQVRPRALRRGNCALWARWYPGARTRVSALARNSFSNGIAFFASSRAY